MINVAEGGTLMQEVPDELLRTHFVHDDGWIPYHELEIVEGSSLEKILGCRRYVSSSIHHQAILELGKDLRIAARAPDAIVEAIEGKDPKHFVLGLQGHIEKTLDCLPLYKNIIDHFIARVEER